jgi:hypothetical protein
MVGSGPPALGSLGGTILSTLSSPGTISYNSRWEHEDLRHGNDRHSNSADRTDRGFGSESGLSQKRMT